MIKKAIGAALLTWATRSLVSGMKRRTARRRAVTQPGSYTTAHRSTANPAL
jgi:hypothetical protein